MIENSFQGYNKWIQGLFLHISFNNDDEDYDDDGGGDNDKDDVVLKQKL